MSLKLRHAAAHDELRVELEGELTAATRGCFEAFWARRVGAPPATVVVDTRELEELDGVNAINSDAVRTTMLSGCVLGHMYLHSGSCRSSLQDRMHPSCANELSPNPYKVCHGHGSCEPAPPRSTTTSVWSCWSRPAST